MACREKSPFSCVPSLWDKGEAATLSLIIYFNKLNKGCPCHSQREKAAIAFPSLWEKGAAVGQGRDR